tara:strand:+ start:1014 stop:1274 length:261 start_codon:yes stop_codon:yes gene_type:complete
VITTGHRQSLVRVIGNDAMHTGLKLNNLGYSSIGDSVPDVMNTDWNFSNTGLTARDASRQHSWNTGSGMFGYRASYGSRISAKPFW